MTFAQQTSWMDDGTTFSENVPLNDGSGLQMVILMRVLNGGMEVANSDCMNICNAVLDACWHRLDGVHDWTTGGATQTDNGKLEVQLERENGLREKASQPELWVRE
jgi:hypothetical protein